MADRSFSDYYLARDRNLEYFGRLLKESANEHHAVAQSPISHLKRFQKILELGDFEGRTVLDVGCGLGGFLDFLAGKGIRCDYTGIDINPDMIAQAARSHPAFADRFFVFDILEAPLGRDFEYVVSNGPLNLRFDANLNLELTVRLLREMYGLASIGAAATMTSALTLKPTEETFYYDPRDILGGTLEFCSNVRLDHTYLPHDFALFLYKRNLYDF